MRLSLVALLLAVSCAELRAGEAGPVLEPARPLEMTRSATGPEVDAVVRAFYGASGTSPEAPGALDTKLEAALRRYPDNPDLHEVAGYLALLRGERDLAELHFARAALDVGAAAPSLFLGGLDPNHDLVLSAARVIAAHSPAPEARVAARRLLLAGARVRGDDAEAERQLLALGVLSRWQVIGAFDNDEGKGFLAHYAPEQGPAIDLAGTTPGVLVPVHWRVAKLDRQGELPLDSLVWPNRQAVAYAVTFVTAPVDADVILWLSSDAPTRVFLDGQLALSRETLAAADADNLALRVHLPAGEHSILLKSANKSGAWRLGARLTTLGGEPVPGLSQSDLPYVQRAHTAHTAHTAKPAVASAFEDLPAARALRGELDEARAHFLLGRVALREGDVKLAVREATAFEAASPGNPQALLALAQASQANEEQGKALDLVDKGVKRFGDVFPEFHRERASLYLDKSLFEKAQEDAEEFLRLRPGALDGQLLLALIEGRRSFQAERCRTLELAAKDHPRRIEPLRQLAQCFFDRGQLGRAEDLLRQATRLGPGSYEALSTALDFDLRSFDDARAERDALRGLTLFPASEAMLLWAGQIAERAGRDALARSRYQSANELSPDSPSPLSHLAELAYRRGEVAEATRLWQEAALRDPANGLLAERLEQLQPTRLGFIAKFVPTDDAIDAAVAAGEKLTPAEGSHAALLLDDEVTEVHADGSATRVVTTVTRAVNDQGRDALIQAEIPSFGRVKLLKAYALGKSGERQEASSVRTNVLRFRNLSVGSTVVLQYVHYAPATHFLPNEYTADWSFQSVAREHLLSRWTLVLPSERSLHVHTFGEVHHEQWTEQGLAVHRFEARNVPPFIEEPGAPPLADLLRRVSVSTVKNWDDYVRWERALLSDAFQESLDLGSLARKLTDGAKTPREKLDRLTAYVAQEIRYQQDYETSIAGVRPHSSRQVLERSYGDCKDKAVLLISLAREVGIGLQFAILRTLPAGEVDREVPNQQFNHAIVYVPKQDGFPEPFFVDATTDGLDVGSLRADDQGAWALVLDPAQHEGHQFIQIPYRPPDEQFERSQVRIRIDDDGKVSVKDELQLRGSEGSQVRRVLRNQAYARKLDEQLAAFFFPASTLAGATAGDPQDVWHPITLVLDVDASNSLTGTGVARRLRLPSFVGLERLGALARRSTPLRLGVPETDELRVAVELPEGDRVVELPAAFEEHLKCLTLSRTSSETGTRAEVDLKLVRTCAEVTPEEYPEFRAKLLRAVARFQDQLAFGPSGKQVARAKPAASGNKGRPASD